MTPWRDFTDDMCSKPECHNLVHTVFSAYGLHSLWLTYFHVVILSCSFLSLFSVGPTENPRFLFIQAKKGLS